ncbi:uncharacterized protein TNCV_4256661 [Trichonephila clavipes]|nr:uncharacterized protein TNCV_4256661 [Trichonephila clavipes]
MIASFVEENHENWDQFLGSLSHYTAVNGRQIKLRLSCFRKENHNPFSKLINVKEDAKYVVLRVRNKWENLCLSLKVPIKVLEIKGNNLVIWKNGRNITVNIDRVRVYRPRQSDTISSDSPIETLYDEQEVSHGSNRSNQGQFKEHRKPLVRKYYVEGPNYKRSKICRKRSRQGSDHQDRKRHAPEQRQGVKRSIPSSISSRNFKFKRPNTSSPGIQSIAGPSKLPDRRNATTTSGSRIEVSGRDNQTRQTRATTRRHNEQAEKTVPSNQTNTRRPCPYYLRSRIQEKDRIHENLNKSKSTAYLAAYSAEEASVWKR